MLEVTAALRAFKEAVEALRIIDGTARTARQRAADVREAKRLLGLVDPSGEAYRSDAVHPLYTPGELHPDNKAALLAAGTDVLGRDPIRRDTIEINATDNSLLLFGSPTSEGLSRVVFGYSELPDRDGLSWDGQPLDLAYAWELDPECVGDELIGRIVPGKGLVKRPPWQIRDLRGSRSSLLVPETDSDGLICEDYLLITRLPNFLSLDAENRGQFLVSFGGAHGTGTRAVRLLFRDKQLMKRVLEELKQRYALETGRIGGIPKAYQLLFRVFQIKHGRAGSMPKRLELVDVAVLRDSPETWDFARRQATPRLMPPPEEDGDFSRSAR
jgi:hypothetical protein